MEDGASGQAVPQWLCADCRGRWCGALEVTQRLWFSHRDWLSVELALL